MRVLMKASGSDLATLDILPAAPQSYQLIIKNQSSRAQSFGLFQTFPATGGVSQDPLFLAWILGRAAAGSVDNPSISTMSWDMKYQTITGYIQPQKQGTGKRAFATSSNVEVNTTTENQIGVSYDGEFPQGVPQFMNAPVAGTSGVITVLADSTLPTIDQQKSEDIQTSVGLAIDGKSAAAFLLEPNLSYTFTPKPTYYILSGSFIAGQLVDTSIVTKAFEVKFAGVNRKTIVFTSKNTFDNE